MVARCVLGAILKSYTGEILTCTWSCTGKQLNVNCGAVTGDLVLPRVDCCACTLYGSMYCASVCTLYIVSCMSK